MKSQSSLYKLLTGLLILAALFSQLAPGLAHAAGGGMIYIPLVQNGAPIQPSTLRSRPVMPKPASTQVNPDQFSVSQVVLKFAEGSHIRLSAGKLVFDPATLSPAELQRLGRARLTPKQVQAELDQVNARLDKQAASPERLFFLQSEGNLAEQKQAGEAQSGEELADLDLYYNLTFTTPGATASSDLINFLNSFTSVEIAYPMPIPTLAQGDLPPTTVINPPLAQGYLDPASSNGIDARYAWTYPGGRGAGVRLIDIEVAWTLDHEDLPGSYFYNSGIMPPFVSSDHGTAVFGELGAADNGFGATGIASDISLGWGSPTFAGFPNFFYNVPAAINNASGRLSAGDIIQIEQHYPGPTGGHTCQFGNCGQFAYVPVEYYQAEFDAIRNATARGIIVTEAAGNGQMNLDESMYGGRFIRSVRDSGAILVGAGVSNSRMPEGFSNFGSRLDVQGWGDSVDTLGYGDVQINGSDQRQWYTRTFSGTSSATPIVSGAVADIQGIRDARGMGRLLPLAMRTLLTSTGTMQGFDPRQVGPLPDLRRALHSFLPQVAEYVSGSVPLVMVTNTTHAVSLTFKNAGQTTWMPGQNYNLGTQNPQDNTTWGFGRQPVTSQVNPGSSYTFAFNITAPASPGLYNFQTRLVQDGVEWFGDFSPNLVIQVLKDNQAHFISQSVPATMQAGASYAISVTYQNSGMTDWFTGQHYALGMQNPALNTTWGPSQVGLPTTTLHGAQVTFHYNVVAPLQAGQYNFQAQMLQNGTEWFGDVSPNVTVNVVSSANNAAFVSQSVTTTMLTDDAAQVSVTMQNIGTATWTAGGLYRLGAQNPQDNMTWGLNRVELPGPVAPGATVTFTFTIYSPLSVGLKNFQWRMVQDNVGWFGQYTPNVRINVKRPPCVAILPCP